MIFLHYVTASIVTYNYGFLLLHPAYVCREGLQSEFSSCSREQICHNQNPDFQWKINFDTATSLTNWIDRLKLQCADSYMLGLFGSVEFLGQLAGSFVFPPMADKFGRRIFTVAGVYVQALSFIMMILTRNIIVYLFSIFMLGVAYSNKNSISYSHLMEYSGNHGSFITGLLQQTGNLTSQLEIQLVFSRQIQNEKFKANQNHQKQQSLLKLLLSTENTITNIGMINVCRLASCTTFYLFNFYIKYLPVNIYMIGVAMGMSCFGYLFSDVIIQRFDVIKCLKLSYGITSSVLVIIVFINPALINVYVYSFMFFILKSFVCMSYSAIFVAHVQIFDSRILATTFGICGIFSRLFALFIPMIAELENKQMPLIIVMGMNILAFGATLFLKRL
ncbi:solute carrier family 22 member 4 [Stylonychia lemnae]|uniref:Solute carrier family 22 member 4 n=1 Tax=Stylonychia lemnae TaxID=5949 RepID=A0A078B667_STYLE|nr:solute carrier family 22 member 4 [Stylonychia lemnae]|eukprot:CDW89023.1 solute carrier family 22 member 4 [Stylonychia lemnae]